MNIEPYTAYFHDGSVLDIFQDANQLVFYLESAEIKKEFKVERSLLSADSRLKGNFCIPKGAEIILDNEVFKGVLLKIHDSGRILDWEIAGNQIYLLIEWRDFLPKPKTNDFTEIKITSDDFVWIPDQ